MALVHEFGIITDINNQESYNHYTPDKYNCMAINDGMIKNLTEPLSIVKTYHHSLKRPENGLAYYGVTIIPPESLDQFLNAVLYSMDVKYSIELKELAEKLFEQKKRISI